MQTFMAVFAIRYATVYYRVCHYPVCVCTLVCLLLQYVGCVVCLHVVECGYFMRMLVVL